MFYTKEIKAIKRADRFRKREVYGENMLDFASNDYLGLSQNKIILEKSYQRISKYKYHSPKASTLVNGYHIIHKEFEEYIASINNFEKAISVGSGFLANLSLFEALPRRGDLLLFDSEFHASGLIAGKMNEAQTDIFLHNNIANLIEKIENYRKNNKGRIIIAVEGIYSMSGDIVNKDIFYIADKYNAILIVDEAHSVGVIGEKLLGVFEYFKIISKPNHIKMGTLGKALGSYGAYILSSNEIYQYLCNRAKAIIYTTAPSVFDISLAYEGFLFIQENFDLLQKKIKNRKKIIKENLNMEINSLILPLPVENSKEILKLKKIIFENGFLIGAIRPPTVKKPILRIIPRINENGFEKLIKIIKKEIKNNV